MNPLRIAISGLHRGENPQPGASIIRSLRRASPNFFIIGLVYDAMESGIYVEGGPDVVYAMPYPSVGSEAFLQRLDEIHAVTPFDVFWPTLDAEIELLVHLESDMLQRGWQVCLPDKESLQRRAKAQLAELVSVCELRTPETEVIYDLASARQKASEWGYPLMVKGQFYDARKVRHESELQQAVTQLLSEWGAPALLQRCIYGTEFNAMGIGDGSGGIAGLCCIRKTIVSDKGKGTGAITVRDPKLEQWCYTLIRELQWRGPFEIEVMYDEAAKDYSLIEINPRFPAWVDFPSQFGVNFPLAWLRRILGETPEPLSICPAGYFYVRHQIEVLGHVDQLADLSTSCDFTTTSPTT